MQMDSAAVLAAISFAVQIAAGVAPVKWPQHAWLASLIFWGACIVAIVSVLLWGYSNQGWLMAYWKPQSLIAAGIVAAVVGLIWDIWRPVAPVAVAPPGAEVQMQQPINTEAPENASKHFRWVFSGMGGETKNGVEYVAGIKISATNEGASAVRLRDGHIISETTGEKLHFLVGQGGKRSPIADLKPVPAKQEVDLIVDFPNGVPKDDFLKQWGGIDFVVEDESGVFRGKIEYQTLKDIFANYRPKSPDKTSQPTIGLTINGPGTLTTDNLDIHGFEQGILRNGTDNGSTTDLKNTIITGPSDKPKD